MRLSSYKNYMSSKPCKINLQSIYYTLVFGFLVCHYSFKSFEWVTSFLNDVEPVEYNVVASETINLSLSRLFSDCLFSLSAVFCLSSKHPPVVNQSLELYSAAAAVLQNPGVCGLAPFKACLPASAQTDTANPAPSMREQPPNINSLLFVLSTKKRKAPQSAGLPPRQTRLIRGICSWVVRAGGGQEPEAKQQMERLKKAASMWWPSSPNNAISSAYRYTNKHSFSSHMLAECAQTNVIDELGAKLWPEAKFSTVAVQKARRRQTRCKHNRSVCVPQRDRSQ